MSLYWRQEPPSCHEHLYHCTTRARSIPLVSTSSRPPRWQGQSTAQLLKESWRCRREIHAVCLLYPSAKSGRYASTKEEKKVTIRLPRDRCIRDAAPLLCWSLDESDLGVRKSSSHHFRRKTRAYLRPYFVFYDTMSIRYRILKSDSASEMSVSENDNLNFRNFVSARNFRTSLSSKDAPLIEEDRPI